MHQAATASSSPSTTIPDPRDASVPVAISNAFALRHLVIHRERHLHRGSTAKMAPPPHKQGTLSASQYRALTEALALVCNPGAEHGRHVMAVSVVDIQGQPPHVSIAINQAHAGQHRDVLDTCQLMLQSIFQRLTAAHRDAVFSTRDQVLAHFAEFGRERICLQIGLCPLGSRDAAVPGAGADDGPGCSKPPKRFLPDLLSSFTTAIDSELASRSETFSARTRKLFGEVSAAMHHLYRVLDVAGDAKRDSTTARPSVEHIVASLKAIYHFYATFGRQLEAIFDDVSTLLSKHADDKVSILRRINYVCWYVRAANFLCNLALGDVPAGGPDAASSSTSRSLAGWLGSAVVSTVDFPEDAFRLHKRPHVPFPQSLPPPAQERYQKYKASRSLRLLCRQGSPAAPKDKARKKCDCRLCAEDIDEQEARQCTEAYEGASGQDKDATPPTVHAEVLLAYAHLQARDSAVGTTPDPVYICSFKKACALCSQFLLCCDPSVLYTLQSHDMIYYRWRLLHSAYVDRHMPRAVDCLNRMVHDAIPDRLPADCFPCCKSYPKPCEDLELDEDKDLGGCAYSTDHWHRVRKAQSSPEQTRPRDLSSRQTLASNVRPGGTRVRR